MAGRTKDSRTFMAAHKWALLLAMLLGSETLSGALPTWASNGSEIYLSSRTIAQGDLSLLRIRTDKGERPQVVWMKKDVPLHSDTEGTLWYGFLGVDLNTRPGAYEVLVKRPESRLETRLKVQVHKKDYGTRRLTLPKNMVDLDRKTLQRVERESRKMKGLWEAPPSQPLWGGAFIRPVPGKLVGPFGQRSVINDQPRSPHSGVDLKGERGTPVKAINHGRVVLTAEHFFTGLSVVIDHGGGILSMYFHLDTIRVRQNEEVVKGEVIGLVGSTGRATGPHLHWGIRVNGARIDPLRLVALSQGLEE